MQTIIPKVIMLIEMYVVQENETRGEKVKKTRTNERKN